MSALQIGDQIIRVPTHANGDIYHADCDEGFVFGLGGLEMGAVFCRYWVKGTDRLRTVANSEATPLRHLVQQDSRPQNLVNITMEIINESKV